MHCVAVPATGASTRLGKRCSRSMCGSSRHHAMATEGRRGERREGEGCPSAAGPCMRAGFCPSRAARARCCPVYLRSRHGQTLCAASLPRFTNKRLLPYWHAPCTDLEGHANVLDTHVGPTDKYAGPPDARPRNADNKATAGMDGKWHHHMCWRRMLQFTFGACRLTG